MKALLINQLKDAQFKLIESIAKEMNGQAIEIQEDELEDYFFSKMMDEGMRNKLISLTEKKDFLNSLGK